MNLEMLRKNNLERHEDLKLFVEHVHAGKLDISKNGPAHTAMALFECLSSHNESYALQIGISFLVKILGLFNNNHDLSKAKIKFNAYVTLLKSLIQEHPDEFKTLPYMKQGRKWYLILLPELKEAIKIALMAIDDIIYEQLEGMIIYRPFTLMIGRELPRLKGLVEAYKNFVQSVVQ